MKTFSFGSIYHRSWQVLKTEVDKCDLLCATCHRVAHSTNDEMLAREISRYKGSVLDFL